MEVINSVVALTEFFLPPQHFLFLCFLGVSTEPLTPIIDQDRISPCNLNTISSRKMGKIEVISMRRLLLDHIPNSPN